MIPPPQKRLPRASEELVKESRGMERKAKSYLTKNNLFGAEDVAAIAKGEEPGKSEEDDKTTSPKKKNLEGCR